MNRGFAVNFAVYLTASPVTAFCDVTRWAHQYDGQHMTAGGVLLVRFVVIDRYR